MISFDEQKHVYTLDGRELISVTQLMKKHGLAPDYSAVSQEVLTAKAERGSLIHKEIEDYIKNNEIGFTEELGAFIRYIATKNVKIRASETIVYNDIVAGTLDLLLDYNNELVIADIKTTSTLHKDAVSWQLSIYAYLLGNDVQRGQAFHFDNEGQLKVVDIPLKPRAEIEKLMTAERMGFERYHLPTIELDENQVAVIQEAQAIIERAKKEQEQAEANMKAVKEAITEAMAQTGAKVFENDFMKITFVEPYERSTIDSARLKKENPEIAEKYSKTNQTKASIKITLKGDKQ